MTLSDFAAAQHLGVRFQFDDGGTQRNDVLDQFAQLAADGQFEIPVAATFPLEDWRTAAEQSLSGHAQGKLVLLFG